MMMIRLFKFVLVKDIVVLEFELFFFFLVFTFFLYFFFFLMWSQEGIINTLACNWRREDSI